MNNLDENLNCQITMEELNGAIKGLKRGKAVAEDMIANEFLIYATRPIRECVLHVYNQCLENGVYPWNTALITPLHKKGSKADPNNYRAIAVGSNLGKLFSSILLHRLVAFRNASCPDPINQLRFCKRAQTSDHIFTLHTCLNKYLHKGRRVYSCFIDYQKAFDSVSREALLWKLSKLGLGGKFFACISHMYHNSRAKLKLIGKLSDQMDVLVGTEQGHPMSPEFFKGYLLDLS